MFFPRTERELGKGLSQGVIQDMFSGYNAENRLLGGRRKSKEPR